MWSSQVGYVQVYDMRGMKWRNYSSRELVEKLKVALETGGGLERDLKELVQGLKVQ